MSPEDRFRELVRQEVDHALRREMLKHNMNQLTKRVWNLEQQHKHRDDDDRG